MRHLTKQELIEKHKNLAAMRNRQYSAPFSAMAITWNQARVKKSTVDKLKAEGRM